MILTRLKKTQNTIFDNMNLHVQYVFLKQGLMFFEAEILAANRSVIYALSFVFRLPSYWMWCRLAC